MKKFSTTSHDESSIITARDVAEESGVSISTVGRALNDDARISARTIAHVREVVDRLGYVQSMAARVMKGGSSKQIGLVLPNINNDFYSTIAQSISKCCEREGYSLVLSVTDDNRDSELQQIRDLAGAKVSGIFIVPSIGTHAETINLLKRIPHVQLLRNNRKLGADWFGIDDKQCLRDATSHLIQLGHRRIAYIGGLEKYSTGSNRRSGFRSAFKDAGLAMRSVTEELGQPSMNFGREAAARLVNSIRPPTAIVCAGAQITSGVLDAVTSLNVKVPRDLSIVGFSDPFWCKFWGQGLTTIRLPIDELATTCAYWFLHSLSNEKSIYPSHNIATSSILVVRNSTARPKQKTTK
jgi:DNA-binding LacI/PurR family transcriptional regulator|tara:strand:+ start:6894 stop:7952 length:1059 start_codon:yes stop_codon:yes gene_type:complete